VGIRAASRSPRASNDTPGLLRNFGLKVGVIDVGKYEARTRELFRGMLELGEIIEPLLASRQKLHEMLTKLRREIMGVQRLLIEIDLHLPRAAAVAVGQLGAGHGRQLLPDEILREVEECGLRKGVVRRRGSGRPEEQDHSAMGQARHLPCSASRPTHRVGLYLWRDLPPAWQGRCPGPTPVQRRAFSRVASGMVTWKY
jgi:hypothetical protein